MKIGFDFDGVHADSHPLKSVIAHQMFGVNIPSERFERQWVVPDLLTKEQYEAVGKEVFFGKHPVLPVKDAVFYTQRLLEHGYCICDITSRSGESLEVAESLLREYGISIPIVGVGYGNPKTDACRGLDVYVDDDLRKLLPLIGIVPHLLLFSWPQNAHEVIPNGITRVADWHGVYNYIRDEVR